MLPNTFKALSEEIRLRIIKLLEHGELCVCKIVSALDMSQPKVSFHLNVLKEAGLIKARKEGRWIHYRLDESDAFKRFLILSVLEKTNRAVVAQDRKRLKACISGKGDINCKTSGAKSKSNKNCHSKKIRRN